MNPNTGQNEDPASHQQNSLNNENNYNPFRHSLLRYAGYANEVGESFRYQFPALVRPSYVVAFGYCLADALMQGYQTWQRPPLPLNQYPSLLSWGDDGENKKNLTSAGGGSDRIARPADRMMDTAWATLDTLLWQGLASVIIPGATINAIVKMSRGAIRHSPMLLPVYVAHWLPTAVGLVSIPLIVGPIDAMVDYLLDHSTRRCWSRQRPS